MELKEFALAVVDGDLQRITSARDAVLQRLGSAVVVDAAGIIARYDSTDRIADATGTQVDAEFQAQALERDKP